MAQAQANRRVFGGTLRVVLLSALTVVTIASLIMVQQWIVLPKMSWGEAKLIMLDLLIAWTVWGLLTPGIIWLARRFPMFRRGRPQPAILLHGVVGTLATAIWSVPISIITWIFTQFEFDGMQPMTLAASYLYELQRRSFYYSLFYWLVVGMVTARLLARDAQEAAAEAARLESEALAADLHAARVHYDPRGLAGHLRAAAELAEADPVRAEEQILDTAGELQRSLALTSSLTQQRPCAA